MYSYEELKANPEIATTDDLDTLVEIIMDQQQEIYDLSAENQDFAYQLTRVSNVPAVKKEPVKRYPWRSR